MQTIYTMISFFQVIFFFSMYQETDKEQFEIERSPSNYVLNDYNYNNIADLKKDSLYLYTIVGKDRMKDLEILNNADTNEWFNIPLNPYSPPTWVTFESNVKDELYLFVIDKTGSIHKKLLLRKIVSKGYNRLYACSIGEHLSINDHYLCYITYDENLIDKYLLLIFKNSYVLIKVDLFMLVQEEYEKNKIQSSKDSLDQN